MEKAFVDANPPKVATLLAVPLAMVVNDTSAFALLTAAAAATPSESVAFTELKPLKVEFAMVAVDPDTALAAAIPPVLVWLSALMEE